MTLDGDPNNKTKDIGKSGEILEQAEKVVGSWDRTKASDRS
jgi:hypothetical protein